MDLFVIDTDDPPERWEELYRAVERRLCEPQPAPPPDPRTLWAGLEIDPLEVLHIAYWNGA